MNNKATNRDFAGIREGYFRETLKLNPVLSTSLGADGYDEAFAKFNGQLRNYRADALDDEQKFYRGVETELEKIDRTTLLPPDRTDYDVMLAQILFLLRQIGELRYHERSIDTYVTEPFEGIDSQIQQMEDVGEGLLGTDAEWGLVAARIEAVPQYLETARENLRAGKSSGNMPDWRMVLDGVDGSGTNVRYFKAEFPKSAERYLGARRFALQMLNRISEASTRAADAYTSFAAFLEQTYDRDLKAKIDRYAIGEKEYQWRLTNCLRDPRSVEDVFNYGAEQVRLYQEKVIEATKEIAREAKLNCRFGSQKEIKNSFLTVRDHLERARAPQNDDELLRWFRERWPHAVEYGREQTMFEIATNYRLVVLPTPELLRSKSSAAYNPAPPFKKAGVGRFYVTPTGNDPEKLKRNSHASTAYVPVHEGFPGHDWHYQYMKEHVAEISRVRWLRPGLGSDSSSMFASSMATEGWALYSQDLMSKPVLGKPHGFYTTAEYFYEAQYQLQCAVRVHLDTGIHTKWLTFDKAKEYFEEHVVIVGEEIKRYSMLPTQAITYNLGKNTIINLRETCKAKMSSQYSDKAFHEQLMRMGRIPAGYYRDEFSCG